MILLQILLILSFSLIAFQDFKERAVVWVLFPIAAVLLAIICLQHTSWEQYVILAITNSILVSCILLILFLYTTYIARKKFINVSFGMGDLLFFYALALGFPTITFILLFVGSIFFSIVIYAFTKKKQQENTVPLAGLMSIFLIGVVLFSFIPNTPSLFII